MKKVLVLYLFKIGLVFVLFLQIFYDNFVCKFYLLLFFVSLSNTPFVLLLLLSVLFVRLIFYCHIDSSEPNVRSTVKLPSKRRDRGGAPYELPSFNLRDLHRICWKKIIVGWINLVAEFKAVWETDGTLSSSTVCITQYGIFEFSPLTNLSEPI